MTPRSLFNIIVKILGIFLIKDILVTIPQFFVSVALFARTDAMPEALWNFLGFLGILCIEAIFCYCLIFRTEWIIRRLKLDQGFDQETIPINIHRSDILKISIIVIGGFLLVNEIPNFCWQVVSYLQEKRMTHGVTNPKIQYAVIAGIKVVIGILLIAEQRLFVNLIERQRKK